MSVIFRNIGGFSLAVAVHLVFVAVVVISLDWSAPTPLQPKVDIVQATTVDESKIQAELDKIKKADEHKRRLEENRKKKAESELRKIEDARRKEEQRRKDEEQKLAKVKKEKEEVKRTAEAEARKRQTEAEIVKKKQQAEKERLARLEQERVALEQQKKELEQKRIREEKRLAEAALQRKLDEEAAKEKEQERQLKIKQDAEREKRAASVIDDYRTRILQKVSSVWIKPDKFIPGLICTVSVKLIPGGVVADAKIVKCNKGGEIFSSSVLAAVNKASPLPVPKDPFIFDKMRDINFIFKPEK